MALFAAYAQATEGKEGATAESSADNNWLENSSFQIDPIGSLPTTSHTTVDEANEEEPPAKKKKKRKKKAKVKELPQPSTSKELPDGDEFSIDKTRNKEFLSVRTITRPSVPKYRVKYYMNSLGKRRKKKFKRYFSVKIETNIDKSNSESEQVITKSNLDSLGFEKPDNYFSGFQQEEELSKTTASFNRDLAVNPNDVEMWLKYIQFQDVVYQFEKTFRKGSIAKGLRVMAERKLAILDKALSLNPNCELLLRERLNIAVSVFPSDELQTQLKVLVEKEQSNIILWQGYIEATQCSMSHCNAPAVLELYIKCLSTLHKLRRNAIVRKSTLEESILRMLYQCGLFLKQGGLFEQLWTMLRLYLDLNLSTPDTQRFTINTGFEEKQLLELEEVIFDSQLPLHELWLRTEKLREACHWLPSTDPNCQDPQRIVFTDDVAELVHPITMSENIFKLTATILTLLKVPLLPCRHVTMGDLGLDYVPWFLDSIEPLLPTLFNLYHLDMSNKNLLSDTRLAVGPQYLRTLPGHEEYLEFIFKVIKLCCDCLKDSDKIAVTIWWFKFNRLLVILDKQGKFHMNEQLKKKMKSDVKNMMKQDAYRNNLQVYCEYALTEYELGSIEGGLNTITKLLSLHKENVSNTPNQTQIGLCHMYKTLVEMLLRTKLDINKNKALKYLVDFVTGKGITNKQVLTQGAIKEAGLIFKNISLHLMKDDIAVLTPVEQFLPCFFTDWMICYGYFIYLTKGAIECGAFLENTLTELDEKLEGPSYHKEVLFEFYIAVLFDHCQTKPGSGTFKILEDVLYRAIGIYPNNLFLLAILAKEQSMVIGLGHNWWKMKGFLLKTNRALPVIFLVLIANQKMIELNETVQDTITGRKYEVDGSFLNRILSTFRAITKSNIVTRRCGLIWRLYLQFVHAYFSPNLCRNVYYSAVEECPWLKSLYIDAAIYIPAELPQIQDLIIEKQLRIHVTPEELEILRN